MEQSMYSVCRTCLCSTDLYPLFPEPAQQQSFTHALFLTTGLQIEADDGLPQNICQECACTIEAAIQLRLQSQAAEKKLQEQLKFHENKIDVSVDTTRNINSCNIAAMLNEVEIVMENNEIENGDASHMHEEIYQNSATSPHSLSHKALEEDEWYMLHMIEPPPVDNAENKEKQFELLYKDTNGKQCKFCKKNDFKSYSSLKKHIMCMHLDPKILCEFCGKICKHSSDLLTHQRSRHGFARDKRFLCSLCDYNGLHLHQLREHQRIVHRKERPYACDECGARFFTRPVLRQHMAVHTNEKPFECHICNKKVKLRNELTHHIHRTHTKKYKKYKSNSKKYKYGCYMCSNIYNTNFGARQHIEKIHGLPFKEQGKLIRHMNEDFESKN